MAQLVRFEDTGGQTVWINPDQVMSLEYSGDDECCVRMAVPVEKGLKRYYVKGSIDETAAKLNGSAPGKGSTAPLRV